MKLKIPIRIQISDYTCGSAVLEMLGAYYGIPFEQSEDHLDKKKEMSGDRMFEIARKMGLEPERFEETDRSLTRIKKIIDAGHPVVVLQKHTLHGKARHYRLIMGYDKDYIYLADPDRYCGGEKKWTYETFFKYWTPQKIWFFIDPPGKSILGK